MATKMTTMTSALENLPSELLEYICSFLSPEDINKLHLVSTSLDNFVVCTFWRRFIHHQCSVDCKLKSLLETQMNWSANSEDYNLISKVYKKIKDEKRWLKESVYSSALMFEFPSDAGFSVRVSSCALYKDKVFVSFVGGNVQCRSCLDFSQIKVLHTAPLNHNSSEPASLITPMSISTNVLAVSIAHESKVYLWDAETLEQLTSFVVPREVNRIYDLRLNASMVICLAGWGLVAFNYKRTENAPVIVYDFHERPAGGGNVFFETHCMEMNESYVLTHASRPLFDTFRSNGSYGPRTSSYLHCRRLLDGPSSFGQLLVPNPEEIDNLEIDKIRFSSAKYNLLCIMHCQDIVSSFSFGVKIMKIPSGEIIQNVLEGIMYLSEVRCPISWVDSRLFMKYSPKIRDYEDPSASEKDVILRIWESETDEEMVLENVGMSSLQEDVMIDHARVVQIFHRLFKPLNDSNDGVTHQVWGKIHDFWNNDDKR